MEHIIVEAIGRNFMVDHVLAQSKIRRKVALITSGYACLVPIIANSDIVVTIPRAFATRVAANTPSVRMIEPPVNIPPVLVTQFWHRKFHNDARNQWLRRLVKDVVATQHEELE